MRGLYIISITALAAWIAAGCTQSSEQLLTPSSGASFNDDIATIYLGALPQSSAVCYSIDGTLPTWNNGQCGDTDQRLAAPFVSAAINIGCGDSSSANQTIDLNLVYGSAAQSPKLLQASYQLNCSTNTPQIQHLGTNSAYDSDGNALEINRPEQSATGDLLVLILHRTDDYLPLNVSGWNQAAQCYKRNNEYNCVAAQDCVQWLDARFCQSFGDYGRSGQDLAQAIFYKTVDANEPASYSFDLNPDSTGHPGWAFLTGLRGANNDSPVRTWSSTGCDGNLDSIFPSVYAEQGDLLLLSQSYDDAIAQSKFGAPEGTLNYGYVSQSDEAGFLYGAQVKVSDETGVKATLGDGSFPCKDALISIAIAPKF